MANAITISPAPSFRDELARRGGGTAARCFQCATCSSVCELATNGIPFPRRQILWAQWGLADRLAADPSIWLCHQCNDCTARCPRDAKPGDALQAIRSLVIERLGAPGFMAKLVGRAGTTWPLLLLGPILFWVVYINAVNGFALSGGPLVYADVVPQWMIYSVFIPAAAFALLAATVGARRTWAAWGNETKREGGLAKGLLLVAADILVHRRFATCGVARPRRTGHLLLLWGFLGAFVTTGLLGVEMDVLGVETPLPLAHPIKLLGNVSAVLLGVGVVWLVLNRIGNAAAAGASRAFDAFFLVLVVLLVFSGVGAEVARLTLVPPVAICRSSSPSRSRSSPTRSTGPSPWPTSASSCFPPAACPSRRGGSPAPPPRSSRGREGSET
jgi:quinone-modifying oxidoreductase subunit QmoC